MLRLAYAAALVALFATATTAQAAVPLENGVLDQITAGGKYKVSATSVSSATGGNTTNTVVITVEDGSGTTGAYASGSGEQEVAYYGPGVSAGAKAGGKKK